MSAAAETETLSRREELTRFREISIFLDNEYETMMSQV